MSIYCSWESVGENDFGSEREDNGTVLAYTGSHVYPDPAWHRAGDVGISHIAPWCVPGHTHDEPEMAWPMVGPWLRLHMSGDGHATAVLDEAAARALAADLVKWADLPKAQPR